MASASIVRDAPHLSLPWVFFPPSVTAMDGNGAEKSMIVRGARMTKPPSPGEHGLSKRGLDP